MQDYATTKGHYQDTTSVDINNARYKRLHRAANHYVLAVVCYAQGHHTTLLCSWSYYYALPQKNKNCLFSIPCMFVGIKFGSNQLHMCLFCVWDVGCATANRRSRFNQLTNHSVRFNSRTYVSLPGETTSVFNHFKSPCWEAESKFPDDKCCPHKKRTPKFPGRVLYYIQNSFCALYNQRRVPSMRSAAPASSVPGTFLSPMVECTMLNNASTQNVAATKEKQ